MTISLERLSGSTVVMKSSPKMEAYKSRQAERAKRFAERNKTIRQDVKAGVPFDEIGRKYSIMRQRVKQIANVPLEAPKPYQHKRAAAIVRERLSGLTFAEMARRHGITTERARQIYIKAINRRVLRALKLHGISHGDKRTAVSAIVRARGELSDSQIPTALGVPRNLVDAVRTELDYLVSRSSGSAGS